MAQGPNPIELYEAAVQQMLPIIAGVQPNQLSSPSPCSDWSVQSLINHNLRVAVFANSVLNGAPGDPGEMFTVAEPLPTEGAEAVFKANTNAVLATAKSMDLETVVETPFGAMPAGNFLMIPMGDAHIHKWDLAKATNQSTTLDSGLSEVCYNVLVQAFVGGRPGPEFFAPEVSVPASASIQDKLLGLSGRQF